MSIKYRNWRKRVILALLTATLSSTVLAMPQNGQVTTGSGSISQQGTTMTINQATNRMGVNWQSFNIAGNETVNFRQPNASSVALNRVIGNSASAIYGALNANGKVFLVNPNGVLFGRNASVNVGGIVASTKDISDANFMAGKYKFAGNSTAAILNQGNLKAAEGGYVAMLANKVTNEGSVTAPKGSVALGAGNAFTLSTDGTGKVNLAVDEAAVNAAAVNSGNIKADGGYVVMSAADAANVVNSVVTNTGVIQAQSLKNDNGTIVLDGGSQGIVNVGGTMDTSAAEADTAGGTIKVNGLYTNVNADAKLMAKATGTQTGGTIETSGDYLYVSPLALINASSEKGMGGTWLLDPLYVHITNTLPDGYSWDNSYTYKNTSNKAIQTYVKADTISDVLSAGTGVTIVAEDNNKVADIIVEAPITKTGGADDKLTLKAQREVRIDADIKSTSGKLDMDFWSDSAGKKSGAVVLNADLDSNGGKINMGSGATMDAGTVGTYIGLKDSELQALIKNDTRTDRNIITKGGEVNIYGDLLLATGDYTNINTVVADGVTGGNVYVSGLIDSGNFYECVTWKENITSTTGHTWVDAQKQSYTNPFGTKTNGGSAIWDSYLANITSNLENSVIESTVNKKSEYTAYYIGAYTKNNGNTVRTWYWADGPEAGKTFYNQTAGKGAADPHGNHTGTDYAYDNWHNGEPNNDGTQTVATIGYGWDSQWDDNKANNAIKDGTIEIPGYIQETNMLRTALKIDAGSGNVNLNGNIGSQRTLWELDITNTGNVRTGGSVQLSDDYYQGKQFYSDMNIHTTGNVDMVGFVDATGNINIGYDKDGNAVSPHNVIAGDTLTAENGAVVIGSSTTRAAAVSLVGKVTAGTGVSIYTNGDVSANGIEAKGNDVSAIATGGTNPAMSTPKVLGNIDINDSGKDSKITLKGTTVVDSTDDSKDDITLFGDKMDLQGPVTTNANTGVVTVSNSTPGNTIDLGSTVDTTANTLELSDAEIDEITASKLVVGNNSATTATKNINITNAITPAGTSVVHMYTGATGGQIKETTTSGTLAPGLNNTLNLAITTDNKVYLDNDNNITTFADVSSGDTTNDTVRLNNGANTLTIGTVDGVTGVTTDATNNQNAVILATENTKNGFVNAVGSTGISVPTTSYWRVFSYSPAVDTFGTGDANTYLASGSYADWQTPYSQGTNVGIQNGGAANQDDANNHYIFAVDKTIVVAPTSQTKNYGDNYNTETYTKGVLGTNYIYVADIYDSNAANDKGTVTSQLGDITLSSDGFSQTANVGTYELKANLTGTDSGYTTNGYQIVSKGVKVTVIPVPLTITTSGSKTYGDADPATDTYKVTASGWKNNDEANIWNAKESTWQSSLTNNTNESSSAGAYGTQNGGTQVLAYGNASDMATALSNYVITYNDSFTIDKATLHLKLTGTREYGDTTKSGNVFSDAAYTIDNVSDAKNQGLKDVDASNYTALTNNVNSILKDNTTATTTANTYTSTEETYLTLLDTVKNDSFLKNYTVTYNDTYTINKAALDVTVSGTKEYGDPSSIKGADYTVAVTDASQLKNGETVTNAANITNTVSTTDNVGSYYNNYTGKTDTADKLTVASLVGDNGFDANNYVITYHTQFDVTPATVTVTTSGTKVYGDDNPATGAYTVTATGWKNADATTIWAAQKSDWQNGISNSLAKGANAGLYGNGNNKASVLDDSDKTALEGTSANYKFSYVDKFEVSPAPLTITADNKSMNYGDQVPALTEQFAGLKNGDTPASIDDTGLYTTGTSNSTQGNYPIDFSGLPNNPNYIITLVPGTLTIKAQVPDPHTDPTPPTQPTNPTNPVTPSNPTPAEPKVPTVPAVQEPIIPGVNNKGNDEGWGLDRIQTKESMPVYLVAGGKATREGAYDVSDDKTGIKMHPTTNLVSDPQDDATEKRSTTVQYTQKNVTGTFMVIFDGSVVKVMPQDAAAKQMVTSNEGTRYVSLFRGALDTALNDMGVILDSVKAVYLVV